MSRPKISSEKWVEYVRTAFTVDPRIAFCLALRFPANMSIKNEVTQLVQVVIFLDLQINYTSGGSNM